MLEESKQEKIDFDSGAFYYLKNGAGRFDLLPPFGLMRVALRCEKGINKYSEDNQFLGIPIKHHICSSLRHIIKYMAGDKSEDHLAAAAQRLLAAIDVEEKHKLGLLSDDYIKLSSWCLQNPAKGQQTMEMFRSDSVVMQTGCCGNTEKGTINSQSDITNEPTVTGSISDTNMNSCCSETDTSMKVTDNTSNMNHGNTTTTRGRRRATTAGSRCNIKPKRATRSKSTSKSTTKGSKSKSTTSRNKSSSRKK